MPRMYLFHVHIADGFSDDCDELIHRCSQCEPLTYQAFCKIWKDMDFSNIYKRRSTAEIGELSEELLLIAKRYMKADTSNFEETVAAVFLVYALLHTQPYIGFASLRLTPDDMDTIDRIEKMARRQRRNDVLYILGSVLTRSSQYHVVERERGIDAPLKKYLDGYTGIDRFGVRPKGVLYRQNEELDIIRDLKSLTRRYQAAKGAIATINAEERRCMNYIDQNMAADMETSMKRVINGILDKDEGSEFDSGSRHSKRVDNENEDASKAQSIKMKAMKNVVSNMRHLSGIHERTKNNKRTNMDNDLKRETDKLIASSSILATGSPRKRKTQYLKSVRAKRRQKQKPIGSISDSDDSDVGKEMNNENDTEDDLNSAVPEIDKESNRQLDNKDESHSVAAENYINIETREDKSKTDAGDVIEIEIDRDKFNLHKDFNIQIESLPVLIRSENYDGKTIQIEIIDQYVPPENETEKPMDDNAKKKISRLCDVSLEKVDDRDRPDNTYKGKGASTMAQICKVSPKKNSQLVRIINKECDKFSRKSGTTLRRSPRNNSAKNNGTSCSPVKDAKGDKSPDENSKKAAKSKNKRRAEKTEQHSSEETESISEASAKNTPGNIIHRPEFKNSVVKSKLKRLGLLSVIDNKTTGK